jgi:heme/copper-type cytochrome/quinol oxidase subunit 4
MSVESEHAGVPASETERRSAVTLGLKVIVGLAVLTVLEFIASESFTHATIPVFALSVLKGWLILDYFMHLRAITGGHGDRAEEA